MTARHHGSTLKNSCRTCSLLGLAILWMVAFAAPTLWPQATGSPKFHVDSNRLQGTLEKLSEFGRNPEGGVTRLGFSETDLAAREYVTGLMRQAGLEVRIDPAGNIFGLRAGSEKLPILLFGSHIDSVLHGGNFDGDVGSMGAIEVMRALNDGGVKTRHPLEAVIWTNEEGNHFGIGTLGSGVAAGSLGPEILERKDEQGLTLADWLRRYGQNPAHVTDARIPPGALTAYLELHIEQGPNLHETDVPIGIVQGIVGYQKLGLRRDRLRQPCGHHADESQERCAHRCFKGRARRARRSAGRTGQPSGQCGIRQGRARSGQCCSRPRRIPRPVARPQRCKG